MTIPVALASVRSTDRTPLTSSSPHYAARNTIRVPGVGYFDLITLDANGRRLYLAHSDRVQVFDIDSDSLIGEVRNTPDVHGVAIVASRAQGFASVAGDTSIVIFDLRRLLPQLRVHSTGAHPDEVTYDPSTDKVFIFNERSGNATVISSITDSIVGTVMLDGVGESAVPSGSGSVYVNLKNKQILAEIDGLTLRMKNRWPLPNCLDPHGLTFDPTFKRLIIACRGVVLELDAASGRPVWRHKVAGLPDQLAIDTVRHMLFIPNGDRALLILNRAGDGALAVVDSVVLPTSFNSVVEDPRTGRAFIPTYANSAKSGVVSESDLSAEIKILEPSAR